MTSATTTIRELRNKDTGIDISVPSHKEIKGLLHSTYEYQVVVVSILPYFKSPKHKESDVVQFAVSRKFQDFEDLYNRLSEKHPATVFPPLPKKVLIVNESSAKARRAKLEDLLKFLAGMPKLSTSAILLEFLGVNAIKAGKYRKEDTAELTTPSSDKTEDKPAQEPESQSVGLFEDQGVEEDDNEDDMFKDDDDDDQDDIFDGSHGNQDTKLFDDQDLGGALEEEDEGLLGIPGATVEVQKTKMVTIETEENSDLFISDEDLKKFEIQDDVEEKVSEKDGENSVGESKERKQEESISVSSLMESIDVNEHEEETVTEETSIKKPIVKEKPKIPERPKPAPRLKPSIPKKQSSSDNVDSSSDPRKEQAKPTLKPKPKNIIKDAAEPNQKPEVKPRPKPALPSKPAKQSAPVTKDKSESHTKPTDNDSYLQREENNGNVDNLNTDDILQYIQSANSNEEEVDLFS